MPINLSIIRANRAVVENYKLSELLKLRRDLRKRKNDSTFNGDMLEAVQGEIIERVNAR